MAKEKDNLRRLRTDIVSCRMCPRLVKFREGIAEQKTKRYSDWEYWGKPVPGFGDRNASIVIVGLAPAAHGGNRTGRVFTGDLSAKFLVDCLCEVGLTNQPNSDSAEDGLRMIDSYMLAAVRCVPPDNRPTREEAENCFPFLDRELKLLKDAKAVLLLGKFAFDSYMRFLNSLSTQGKHRLLFRHGAIYHIDGFPAIYSSYHPSPRNTNTGTLTRRMFIDLLRKLKKDVHPG